MTALSKCLVSTTSGMSAVLCLPAPFPPSLLLPPSCHTAGRSLALLSIASLPTTLLLCHVIRRLALPPAAFEPARQFPKTLRFRAGPPLHLPFAPAHVRERSERLSSGLSTLRQAYSGSGECPSPPPSPSSSPSSPPLPSLSPPPPPRADPGRWGGLSRGRRREGG